jgi:hypothetical protein
MAVKRTNQTTIVSADRETVASGRRSGREAQPYKRTVSIAGRPCGRAAGYSTAHHKKKTGWSLSFEVMGLEPLGC